MDYLARPASWSSWYRIRVCWIVPKYNPSSVWRNPYPAMLQTVDMATATPSTAVTALITAPPKSASDAPVTTSSSTSSGLDRRTPRARRLGPPRRACERNAPGVVHTDAQHLRLPRACRGRNCVRALLVIGARACTAAHRVRGARRRIGQQCCAESGAQYVSCNAA